MATHDKKNQLNWHLNAVPKATCTALNTLSDYFWLRQSKWYLAGGTAMALQAGHRISVDLDFFLPAATFRERLCLYYGNVRVLDIRDIAVMKIVAISQRGRKRDFFDLYWYVTNRETLRDVFLRLPAQYSNVAHNYHHIIKSITFFDDAEHDPEPELRFKASWREVKQFFRSETPRLMKQLMYLR